MHYYIATRFSVFDHTYKGYQLVHKNDVEKYKQELFSEGRLAFKFHVFETITLPSVVKQTNPNWTWLLYTSPDLPDSCKARLEEITRPYPGIKIRYVSTMAEAFDDIDMQIAHSQYATLRLDDDDAIHVRFLEWLESYATSDVSIVSFPRGRKFTIQNGKFQIGGEFYYPAIAIGLTMFNSNIYKAGVHSTIAQRFKTTYDDRPNAYCICCSEYCDTGRRF